MRLPHGTLPVFSLVFLCLCASAAAQQSAPVVKSLEPPVVNPGATAKLLIEGANFVPNATRLEFVEGTGVSVRELQIIDSKRLAAELVIAPSASRGLHRIAVTTPAGSNTPATLEVLDAPVLTGITPVRGSENTQITVTLNGTFFHPDSRLDVSGAGITVADVTLINDTAMNATLIIAPGARSGPRHVAVRNRAGSSGALVFQVDGGAGKS